MEYLPEVQQLLQLQVQGSERVHKSIQKQPRTGWTACHHVADWSGSRQTPRTPWGREAATETAGIIQYVYANR